MPDLIQKTPDRFESLDGFVMQREWGKTPNGNPIGGDWVLRCPDGSWIDSNQYRHDLAEHYNFNLIAT